MNSSLGDRDAFAKYYGYNNTNGSYRYAEKTIYSELGCIILICLILITCCTGFLGNGYIMWLLGFQIKRNPFTTFVLNLAIADFGFLIAVLMRSIDLVSNIMKNISFNIVFPFFFDTMYINSHFLLTAISIDRCVSVLFPIWHRCSRPKYLSPFVCALLWIFSFLVGGIHKIMLHVFGYHAISNLHFLLTAVLCFPLITVCTVILFIKIGLKSKQKNWGRLLLMIFITLLCYLILVFPLHVFVGIFHVFEAKYNINFQISDSYFILCACLNSSINPVIYFLVVRKKQAQSKEGLKVILQKVFEEGEATGGT